MKWGGVLALWLGACSAAGALEAELTVALRGHDAFAQPVPGLGPAERASFFVGNSYFNQNWVAAPGSVASRDGLGPRFNARSCSGCHFKDGRGRPPGPGQAARSMLVRVSVPGHGPHGAPLGDARYGDQLQGQATPGEVAEAEVLVQYEEQPGRFQDGKRFSLRRPHIALVNLGHGPLSPDVRLSARVAPQLVGLGLLEAVSDQELARREDPDDRDGDGLSGRANRVWSAERRSEARGRFGWKAEQPSVLTQTAGAFLGDMGLTSRLFPGVGDAAALDGPAKGPEVDDAVLDAVAFYARSLAVPARRTPEAPIVRRGERLFAEAGCDGCHLPTLATGDGAVLAHFANRTIHPYTDLLLHDMGEGLADGRETFVASGREWRTPPLWGVGLISEVNGHAELLHDGRARGVAEAVLWHGGEAQASRDRFVAMDVRARDDLIAFVESL